MKKTNHLIVIFGIFILIILRFIYQDNGWIIIIQYLGLIIAYLDLFGSAFIIARSKKNFRNIYLSLLVGAFIIVFVSLIAMATDTVFLRNGQALDIVSLVTLLFSLPRELYIEALKKVK